MTITKTVRVDEFGRYEFRPDLGESIVGRDVEIRDWYGDVRARVLEVHISELSGYPCGLGLELADGRRVPVFALTSTREIEVL